MRTAGASAFRDADDRLLRPLRQRLVEPRQIAGRRRLAELPQPPNRVELHRRQRIPKHPDQCVVGARRANCAERNRDADAKRPVLHTLQFFEKRIQGRRIAQLSERPHDCGPLRKRFGVAQTREQRSHCLVHACASERRSRPEPQRRVLAGQQTAEQIHRLRPGKSAECVDGAAPHQGVCIGSKRLDDEVEAFLAPETTERGDAITPNLFPCLIAQALTEHGKCLGIGEASERRVRGRADSMAGFAATQEIQQRRRPSRFAPVADRLRGSCPHVGRLASKRGDERLEGDGPMFPTVPLGAAGRTEQRNDEDEDPARVSAMRGRHQSTPSELPVKSRARHRASRRQAAGHHSSSRSNRVMTVPAPPPLSSTMFPSGSVM